MYISPICWVFLRTNKANKPVLKLRTTDKFREMLFSRLFAVKFSFVHRKLGNITCKCIYFSIQTSIFTGKSHKTSQKRYNFLSISLQIHPNLSKIPTFLLFLHVGTIPYVQILLIPPSFHESSHPPI